MNDPERSTNEENRSGGPRHLVSQVIASYLFEHRLRQSLTHFGYESGSFLGIAGWESISMS